MDAELWPASRWEPEIFKEMQQLGVLNDGTRTEHAMGQFIGTHQNEELVFHAGADAGFVAFTARFPKRQLSIMLLGNCSAINAQQKSLQIADCFFNVQQNPDTGDSEAIQPVKLADKDLETLVGQYFDSENKIARAISMKNSNLVYARPEQGGRESSLVPLGDRVFRLQGTSVNVVFGGQGSVRTLSVIEDGKRVEQYSQHSITNPTVEELQNYSGNYISKELETAYVVAVSQEQLYVTVPRIGDVKLEAIAKDGFCTQGYPFNYLEFERDSNGAIQGLRVSSGRAKNVFFKNQDAAGS